ncbi:hypothetical protein HMPREF9318_01245 [Streptococcus urinalis FB127-CNA-2]|uniref:PAP2 family protein n=2 Tax=Streptococcus urinalis TaxID=149016 RepID=G5KC93_9STRE|nr:PAP2 family protein [Streptococcus urinalis 2285-97]EKS19723.1 hypothetical protein HMPREF9318_01245 [Streptococcus urinalis FB127-CNA-2]VEF31300.1 phosphatidylglycerophosphatase B [Streptococcus urinalis]
MTSIFTRKLSMYSYPAFYKYISRYLNNHRQLVNGLFIFNRLITKVMFFSYPIVVIYSLVKKMADWPMFVIVPAISFLLVTGLRKVFNARRPYEVYPINPLEKKVKAGESFPSRHVFSATMIAMVIFTVNPILGKCYFGLAFLLAIIRVLLGVHFLRDVFAGLIIGFLAGLFLK